MSKNNFKVFAEYYDRFYLRRKDYENEAKIVKNIIRAERKEAKALLDVGCGTGEHLKYFSPSFQCMGLDINSWMIEAARRKVPDAKFKVANMIDFSLKERFDIIVCLFSAIGYVQTFSNLRKTLQNFRKHLNESGRVIVEPWVFKKDFKQGHLSLDTYENENTKFARMATSRITRSKWLIYMHYLFGEKGEIKYFTEIHKMLAADCPDYVEAFKLAGFKDIKYLTEDLWDHCRGLFVATR